MAAARVWGALRSGFIKVRGKLTHVLCVACLRDKNHTEALQREREDESATTTTTMMNLEEVGREFERSVIDEGQGIPMGKIHTEASQREREDESATTTSTMMNLEEVGREFERSFIDEGQGIPMGKIHTEASQREREDESATTTSTMMNLEEVGREFERSFIDEGQGIPMGKIHTEASQREREDESATTTSKMMNLEEVGREFERSVIDEGQGIPMGKIHTEASQREREVERSVIDEGQGIPMGKIHTEASQREREDESATTTSTMMNLEEVGREFERSVIDEGQGIPMGNIHTEASQREREDQSATTTSTMMNSKEVGRAFERSVIDEGNQIRERIKFLFERASHLRLNLGVPTRSLQRVPAPLVGNESDVVGRDGDKKKIIELLLSDDAGGRNLSVIPIVGMGGIGKTTLADLVYKDSRVQQHFDSKAWVTVSEDFDVSRITKIILEKVTSKKCKTDVLYELQSKLKEALAGKRFLFVLDDVWNEAYRLWDSLRSTFESGAHGSRIIVTTRSKDVALTMNQRVRHMLKLVSDDDCWRIFEKHAFDDSAEATAELQEIGRKIVKRCKGLPLAVKSVAGILRFTLNPEEWRKILNSDIWQLQFQENLKNDIVPALWLSYHFLPTVLKRCFAYCSIFPKDYEFGPSDMEKIILLWMAEGLLTPENGKEMEDVGKTYLEALISRSFFQHSSTEKSAMVMHDLVHDLAMFISGEFCFSCGDSNDLSNLGTKSCHLSYRKVSDDLTKLGAVAQSRPKKLMSLRTVLALPLSFRLLRSRFETISKFFKVEGCLRVLSLSKSSITELPDSIGNTEYLRYLDLSGTLIKELPDSICTSYNLQTLLLSGCTELARLPTGLAALVNLRHLDIRDTPLKEMPPQMCKMKSLQTLSDFVLGEQDSWRIKELGEFPLLKGSLCISGLEYIVDVKDVLEANLKDQKFLSELILKWGGDSYITCSQQEKVLETLQPHTNLKQLRITGYGGTIFPDWVGHESFCNIVKLHLQNCRNVCMLPTLGQLSSPRRLRSCGLDGVVSTWNEFSGSSSSITNHPFTLPTLGQLSSPRRLRSCGLDGVVSTWNEFSGSSSSITNHPFTCLEELYITGCQKLWENRMNWGLERLPSLVKLSLSEIKVGDSFPEEGLLPTTLTELYIDYFINLKRLNGRAFQQLTSLQRLSIWFCNELECLPREGLPLSLSRLTIGGCPLLQQRCRRGTGKDWPKIQHIPIILP